jgi:hypothetical protein
MKTWQLGVLALFVGACQMPDSESTGNASAPMAGGDRETISFDTSDPSVFTWARIYCTADNESHVTTESADLGETNFAPPAPPLYVGGGGAVTATFFGGFDPDWGAGDLEQKIYHAAPAVQWWTILKGSIYVETTDGDSRVLRAGDVMHLEDTAPCKGHISHNMSDEAAFMQFVR